MPFQSLSAVSCGASGTGKPLPSSTLLPLNVAAVSVCQRLTVRSSTEFLFDVEICDFGGLFEGIDASSKAICSGNGLCTPVVCDNSNMKKTVADNVLVSDVCMAAD